MKCVSTVTLRRDGHVVTVPCGKCPPCLSNKRSEWTVRLLIEMRQAISAHFITLTYDDGHLPEGELPSLDKRDVQLFLKRLRKLCEFGLRYYLVGEYGGQTGRPHYHAIMFNISPSEVEVWQRLDATWEKGNFAVGGVTEKSIAYVCKYLINNWNEEGLREKPFALMSRKPGLGVNYLTPEIIKYHKDLIDRNYVTLTGVGKRKLPRYYRDRIYCKLEREVQSKKAELFLNEVRKKAKKRYLATKPVKDFETREFEIQRFAIELLTKNQKKQL